jgi:hypothetical protein
MESSADFREQAKRCRRLARSVTVRADPLIAALLNMATELDAKAAALEAREGPAKAPGRARE